MPLVSKTRPRPLAATNDVCKPNITAIFLRIGARSLNHVSIIYLRQRPKSNPIEVNKDYNFDIRRARCFKKHASDAAATSIRGIKVITAIFVSTNRFFLTQNSNAPAKIRLQTSRIEMRAMTASAKGAEPAMVHLKEIMDLAAAQPLAKSLLDFRGHGLVVNASKVTHLGAQCAQILMSALATWRVDGHDAKIIDASSAFQDGARLLGLAPFLISES